MPERKSYEPFKGRSKFLFETECKIAAMNAVQMQKVQKRLDRYPHADDGTPHWILTPDYLQNMIDHLKAEVVEFEEAIRKYKEDKTSENLEALKDEAADVCNMTLTVLDRVKSVNE